MDEYHKARIRILDGGFGTQISKRINKILDGDVLWSARLLATNKEDVINTHLDFLKAGSNVIETNTYQASIDGFVNYLNLSEADSYNLILESVEFAKKARNIYNSDNPLENKNILIAGSVGPYGASLHDGSEYTGGYKDSVTFQTLKEWHTPRISALINGGVDLLALETLPCRKEAEVLLSIIKEYPNTKAWLSFNCKDEKHLASGEDFQETVRECYKMNPEQLVAVGANCVSPILINELFSNINDGIKTQPIPLIAYPNSGEFYNKENGWFGLETCKPISSYVDKWLEMGITWIGGCCRTYAEQIAEIKQVVKSWEARQLN